MVFPGAKVPFWGKEFEEDFQTSIFSRVMPVSRQPCSLAERVCFCWMTISQFFITLTLIRAFQQQAPRLPLCILSSQLRASTKQVNFCR